MPALYVPPALFLVTGIGILFAAYAVRRFRKSKGGTERERKDAKSILTTGLCVAGFGVALIVSTVAGHYHREYRHMIELQQGRARLSAIRSVSDIAKMELRCYGDGVPVERKDWDRIFDSLRSMKRTGHRQRDFAPYGVLITTRDGREVLVCLYEANPGEFKATHYGREYLNNDLYPLLEPYEREIQTRYYGTEKDRNDRSVTRIPAIKLPGGIPVPAP